MVRAMRSWLSALCVLLLPGTALALPFDGEFRFTGPLGVTQDHPLRQALLDVPLVGPLDRPSLRIARGASNIWNSETYLATKHGTAAHVTDLQQESLVLDATFPVGHFFALGVRAGAAHLWGGGDVDTAIETFHGLFDFYNFDRHYAPRGRTRFAVVGPSGPSLLWEHPRNILQSPVVSLFARVLEGKRTRVLFRVDGQVPLGDVARTLQLYAPELGTGISVSSRIAGLLVAQVAMNAWFHGNRVVGGLTVNPVQWQLEGSLEMRLLPFLTFVVEDRIQTPLFEKNAVLLAENSLSLRATSWNAYFTPVNLISFGPRMYLPFDATLTVYATEDFMFCTECYRYRLSRETNAPDISGFAVLQKNIPAHP